MATTSERLLPPAEEHKLLPPPSPPAPPPRRGRWLLGIAIALVLLAILFLVGYLPRHNRKKAVAAAAQNQAESLPVVNVTKARRSPGTAHMLLPGDITPLTEAYIYARAAGYVRKRYADIGDRVRQGQVLADIEAPDLDQQVVQARATVAQAEQQLRQAQAALQNSQAQEELARVTWERYRVLVMDGAVSRQEADQQLANYKSATAAVNLQQAAIATAEENIRANRADLERLLALQGFEHVVAPFTGIITARNFDIGALVSSNGASLGASTTPGGGTQQSSAVGTQGTNATSIPATPSSLSSGGGVGELYREAQIGVLRILVNVPQGSASTVRTGQPASVFVQEYTSRAFQGKVTRTSNALDPASRTLLVEVQVPNPQSLLLPGMYAEVQFSDIRANPPLLVPGDSIIPNPDGLEIGVLRDLTQQQRQNLNQVQKDQEQQAHTQAKQIHLQKIEVGRDYGPVVEVLRGLEPNDYTVVNPGDSTQEGSIIIPHDAPAAEGGNAETQGGPLNQRTGGIGIAPRMAAPTQSPQEGRGGKKGDGR
ncbi:MAG: efflux RND transporter periplasmic adaptor subunit [Acidobacteriia bacterium]|nr:efflux RND transporter periplasmic adaptor subunit [Terriglobia bacterium]